MEVIGIHLFEGRERKGKKTLDVTESYLHAEIKDQGGALKN